MSGWIGGAVAAMLVVSAVIRWSTPHPKALRLSSGLIVLAAVVGLTVWQLDKSESDPGAGGGSGVSYELFGRGSAVTEAEVDAVPDGATRAGVRARLGAPAAYGSHRYAGSDLRCLGYRMAPRSIVGLCFRNGRYTAPAEVMPRSWAAARGRR